MEPKVFLHYTQAELDRNYDQLSAVPHAHEITSRYGPASIAARETIPNKSYAYGPHPDEVLDFFFGAGAGRPAAIFVHGGAWKSYTKDDYSFVARSFADAGINCVVLNFSKLPEVRMPVVIGQLRRAMAWLVQNAAMLGIDPARLYLCGHSSGAHMAGLLAVTDWPSLGLPQDLFKGTTLISGAYDLEPVMISARRSYVHLSPEEVHELSPIRHVHPAMGPVLVAYAQYDTGEFRRHSIEMAAALRKVGRLSEEVCLDNTNHFEIVELLGTAGNILTSKIVAHLRSVIGEA
jgi:arylformamidase